MAPINFAPPVRAVWLAEQINKNGWRRGAELGVLQGKTFCYLLRNCPALESLIGVDTWAPQPDKEAFREIGGRSYAQHDLEGYYAALQRFVEREPRGQLWRMTTLDAAPRVLDGTLDFVFIDADHMEEAVRADIRAWLPRIARRGMIAGHDRHFPSVLAAIDDMLPGWQPAPDNVWYRAT